MVASLPSVFGWVGGLGPLSLEEPRGGWVSRGASEGGGWLHLARLDPRAPEAGATVLRGGACEDRAWIVGAAGTPFADYAFVAHVRCPDARLLPAP